MALRKSYLWRNYFDEFIEKTELAHFIVKPFPTVFHTCLQNLGEQHNAKCENSNSMLLNAALRMQRNLFENFSYHIKKIKSVVSHPTTDPGSDPHSPAEPAWPPTPVETGSCGPGAWWPAEAWNRSHKPCSRCNSPSLGERVTTRPQLRPLRFIEACSTKRRPLTPPSHCWAGHRRHGCCSSLCLCSAGL